MNYIIVLGSGAREYAIIKKLRNDCFDKNVKLICFKNNINDFLNLQTFCDEVYNYTFHDLKKVILQKISEKNKILFAVIGSENQIDEGISDYFEEYCIPCLAPLKIYSQIETSKIFCRNFVNQIPELSHINPEYYTYENCDIKNSNCFENLNFENNEYVVKNDGLCKGKGVFVQNNDFTNISDLTYEQIPPNTNLVIEEKLVGEEFSLMTLTDGNGSFVHFPPIQDFKRLNNDNNGPNTGSMGCFMGKNQSLPFLSTESLNISQNINETIIKNLNNYGKINHFKLGYRGILYGSFIKTTDGNIKLIEVNCRFGDPECILALESLESNFFDLCTHISNQTLSSHNINFSNDSRICVYMVPKFYPFKKPNNYRFDIYFNKNFGELGESDNIYNLVENNNIYFGNVEVDETHIYSLTSRTLALTESAPELYKCFNNIYKNLNNILGNLHYRTDIAKTHLNSYEASGVSVSESSKSLDDIKEYILSTYNNNVISEFGSFGGEYKFDQNILVSSIDGVGSKILLSKKVKGTEGFENLGVDLVSHSINDILVQGATPLFFLDYFGASSLNRDELKNFIYGVSQTCNKYGNIPILGGETAEMPSVYKNQCVDLVGCIIGVKDTNYFKKPITTGDKLYYLKSVGPHTNGFTLINNIVNNNNVPENVLNMFLEPHKCYINEVYEFIEKFGYDSLHGMCHITGGGLYENMNRIIPKNMKYSINDNNVKNNLPLWCNYLVENGKINYEEMINIYNCGIGFVLVLDESCTERLSKLSYELSYLGEVL